jgi:hypothetical protein
MNADTYQPSVSPIRAVTRDTESPQSHGCGGFPRFPYRIRVSAPSLRRAELIRGRDTGRSRARQGKGNLTSTAVERGIRLGEKITRGGGRCCPVASRDGMVGEKGFPPGHALAMGLRTAPPTFAQSKFSNNRR